MSCKTPKETDDLSTLTKEMEMQKNPLFWEMCCLYVLTIYKGGIAAFDGKQYVEKYGLYTKKLSKSEYKKIKKSFQAADFWTLDDNYPSDIHDIPKVRLTFNQKGKTKTVTGDINRPEVIKNLEKEMVAIADSEGWTLRSVPDINLPDYYIQDELIISLRKEVDIKEWKKKYDSWNMIIEKNISTNRNLWLVKYNNPQLKPSQVMNILSLDEDVLVLEFNKKVEFRDD